MRTQSIRREPFIGNRRYPVRNPSPYLGQVPQFELTPPNRFYSRTPIAPQAQPPPPPPPPPAQIAAPGERLLGVRTGAIASRFGILGPVSGEIARLGPTLPIDFPNMTEAEKSVLLQIAQHPTEADLSDVGLIDSLYITDPVAQPATRVSESRNVYQGIGRLKEIACSEGVTQPASTAQRVFIPRRIPSPVETAGLDPRFFCAVSSQLLRFPLWDRTAAELMGIRNDVTWREERTASINARVILDALVTYPFPSPIPAAPAFWYRHNREALIKFAHSDMVLSETLVRLWATVLTAATYNDVAAQVIDHLEEEAKEERRRDIIKAVIIAGVALTLGFALGSILAGLLPAGVPVGASEIASAVTSVIQKQYTENEREKAAEELESIARVFEATDPAYAAEARKAAETFDYLAASAARATGLTAEEAQAAEAIRRQQPTTSDPGYFPPEEEGIQTGDLLVGGGIAAAGVVLLALLR